jgi:hypothetical protein
MLRESTLASLGAVRGLNGAEYSFGLAPFVALVRRGTSGRASPRMANPSDTSPFAGAGGGILK